MKLIRIYSLAILCLAMALVSCADGEDGANGMDGINGIDGKDGADGQDGANGQDGQDGANGLGFDELAQYGHIVVNMEGTRPDGVAFQDTATYRFTPVGAPSINYVVETNVNNINAHGFGFRRFLSAPDDIFQSSYIRMGLDVFDLGQASQEWDSAYVYLSDYAVVGEDHKYFVLFVSNPFLPDDTTVQDFVFDDATNHLTFSYSITVPAANNSSGHDLLLSGTVDVTVLEQVEQ